MLFFELDHMFVQNGIMGNIYFSQLIHLDFDL